MSNASSRPSLHHRNTPSFTPGAELDLGLAHCYRLDGLLARSTCGDIWQATWMQTLEAVTIKALRSDALPSERMLHREALIREGEHLRRLSHRHIVRILRTGLCQGQPVLVLERLHESLKDYLARRSAMAAGPRETNSVLYEAQATAWIRQAAQGLQTLHRSGLKHLDVKPANLLLTPPDAMGRQVIKLADFGASLPLAVAMHRFVGTPGFAAPEQSIAVSCDGDGQPLVATSCASDWYALGQVLNRLLTGRLTPSGEADLRRFRAAGWHGKPHAALHGQAAEADESTWRSQFGAFVAKPDQQAPSTPIRPILPQTGSMKSTDPSAAPSLDPSALVHWLCSKTPAQRIQGAAVLLDGLRKIVP